MFEIVESLSVKGNPVMEDRIGWGEKYLFVIDGASGLTPAHVTRSDSDAAWLAERLRQGLTKMLPDETRDVPDILADIASELRTEYQNAWSAHYDTAPVFPSAGVAIVRQRDPYLECFALGDCTVTVEFMDGDVKTLEETELTRLDRQAIAEMAELSRSTGCTMLEARKALNHVLIRNRNLLNHPDGYWIFDPTGLGIPHIRMRKAPAEQVRCVCAMTDGFSQLVEPFGVAADAAALHGCMRNQGLAVLAAQLFALQDGDPNCDRYPRFKLRDDTTAILARMRPLPDCGETV